MLRLSTPQWDPNHEAEVLHPLVYPLAGNHVVVLLFQHQQGGWRMCPPKWPKDLILGGYLVGAIGSSFVRVSDPCENTAEKEQRALSPVLWTECCLNLLFHLLFMWYEPKEASSWSFGYHCTKIDQALLSRAEWYGSCAVQSWALLPAQVWRSSDRPLLLWQLWAAAIAARSLWRSALFPPPNSQESHSAPNCAGSELFFQCQVRAITVPHSRSLSLAHLQDNVWVFFGDVFVVVPLLTFVFIFQLEI